MLGLMVLGPGAVLAGAADEPLLPAPALPLAPPAALHIAVKPATVIAIKIIVFIIVPSFRPKRFIEGEARYFDPVELNFGLELAHCFDQAEGNFDRAPAYYFDQV